jgi:hypothetical protein
MAQIRTGDESAHIQTIAARYLRSEHPSRNLQRPVRLPSFPILSFTSGFLIAGELPSSTPPAALGASTVPPQNPPAPAILARMLVPDQPPQPKGAREPLRKSVSAQCTTLNRRMEMHSGVCRLHLNRGRFDLPGYYA